MDSNRRSHHLSHIINFGEFVEGRFLPEDRKILVVGSIDPSFGLTGRICEGREAWQIAIQPNSNGGLALHRSISGRLLSLAVGAIPLHAFDLILVLGDLPFGSELLRFLERVRNLLGSRGRCFFRVSNPLNAHALTARLANSFSLESSGAFTPSEFRCALAEAQFRLEEELTSFLPDDEMQVHLKPLDPSGNLAALEKTFVATPVPPCQGLHQPLGPPRDEIRTSIIVLTYNSLSTIEECLRSVVSSLSANDEVIVVDNASSDETVSWVSNFCKQSSQVLLITNQANLGFSAGCNVGILASRGQFVALLNPDTVVWPGWIESLERPFADPAVGMVGPVSDRIAGAQFLGHYLAPANPPLSFDELAAVCRQEFGGQYVETKLLIGLCVMMRRETLEKVGLLDEDLYLGSDDLELSWRLRTHRLKLLISQGTFVRHLGGVSFSSLEQTDKSRLLFESTEALLAKVRAYYGWNPPDSLLWGIEITHR